MAKEETKGETAAATLSPREDTIAAASQREQLLGRLSAVKAVRLNTARESIFTLRSSWVDSRSQVLLSISRVTPTAVFGKDGVPAKDALPDHCLISLVKGLAMGALLDVSANPAQAPANDYRSAEGRARVERGLDPVMACGEKVDVLDELLKAPSRADSKDPDGAVVARITDRFKNEYKVLVALQYLERCRPAPRQVVLGALEDMIHACPRPSAS